MSKMSRFWLPSLCLSASFENGVKSSQQTKLATSSVSAGESILTFIKEIIIILISAQKWLLIYASIIALIIC